VAAEQAFVEQRRMPRGERVEVGVATERLGAGWHGGWDGTEAVLDYVVSDQFHPRPGDGVVVLLRRALVRGKAADPVADAFSGGGHAVSPHRPERQVDVLAVTELPSRPGDGRQDRREFRIGGTRQVVV
jgi:hypothetical protein